MWLFLTRRNQTWEWQGIESCWVLNDSINSSIDWFWLIDLVMIDCLLVGFDWLIVGCWLVGVGWLVGGGWLVGWLVVGWLVGGLIDWLVEVGGWLLVVIDWLIGDWLIWLVGVDWLMVGGWLVGWLIWLVGLVGWLVVGGGGLIDWLIGWLVGWLVGWLIDWLIGWLVVVGWLVCWLVGWLCWLVGWLVDWLVYLIDDWLIDWLIDWWLIQSTSSSLRLIYSYIFIKTMMWDIDQSRRSLWHLRDGPKESRMNTKNITSWIRTCTTQLSTMAMVATPAYYFEQIKSNLSVCSQFNRGGKV